MKSRASIGFDFGTASVRVLVADIRDGRIIAEAVQPYQHGVIDRALPTGESLPADYAFQHPSDWLNDAATACRSAMAAAEIPAGNIVGVGVDFTSCTMLPTRTDGTPLCLLPEYSRRMMAWPKLWKHHGAKAETDRINLIATQRSEAWLTRYGGTIGLEWFFPKVLETLNHSPDIYSAAEVWIEAGDWFVWQMISGPFPCDSTPIPRSTCQAGYKAMWNSETGYPSSDYFAAVHPNLSDVVDRKMIGSMVSPGVAAGRLTNRAADLFGLVAGTPVSAAVIDAHAGVPGAGVAEAGTMVLVMGTSACHMMNSNAGPLVNGVAGVVQDGILPGFFGYETGQASFGDAFGWLVSCLGKSYAELTTQAALLPPGSNGLLAVDWLNGCRTPLMDANLRGAFVGMKLDTKPSQLYRALLESAAFGLRWIVDTLKDGGVPVHHFVASGGLPDKSPLLMQICADVLNAEIRLAQSNQSCGLGAAILGCAAAGNDITGYLHIQDAVHAMARQRTDLIYRPQPAAAHTYETLYKIYRSLARPGGELCHAMRQLSALRA
jgi:L-ribulokinase